MKENRMDRLTDKLGIRVDRVMGRLGKINKNTNPYRQEPVPDEQRIMDYQEMLDNPDILQQFEQSMPPDEVQKYHGDMHELINRRLRNA